MKIFDGKQCVTALKANLKQKIEELPENKRKPKLAALLVGDLAASQLYVKNKVKTCEEIGMISEVIRAEENISHNDLLEIIYRLNSDETVDGYIVQLPLPKQIDESQILLAIDPKKDVDGFHPHNLGLMLLGLETFVPATPKGIMSILKSEKIKTAGAHCVVIGRSNIVGTPMALLLSRKGIDCTVTLVHSQTKNIKEFCASADILIAAIGKANFVTADMVKDGAVVIDVGINRIDDPSTPKGYRVVGDVDFEHVKEKASFITPVPGGVGMLTVISLIENTWMSFCRTENIANG